MNESNLRPIIFKSDERAKALGRIGGLARTPAKTLAAKLRELKRKGLTDQKAKELYEVMTDPALSALDLRLGLERIRSLAKEGQEPGSALTTNQKVEVAKAMLDLHKAVHGTKISINEMSQSVNIDIQTSMTPDDIAAIVHGAGPLKDSLDAARHDEPL